MSQTKPDTAPASSATDDVLLSIRGLKTYYSIRGSFGARLIGREAGSVKAVDDISLDLHKGEVLGLVGESGSGKTTLGRTLLGLVKATAGSVMFEGRDITRLSERELRKHRRQMQIVFQDPHASLNPAMTIEQAVGHPLQIHGVKDRERIRLSVAAVLRTVGLIPRSSSWTSTRQTCRADRNSEPFSRGRSSSIRRCSCATSPCRCST